jgi:hypothetical protein
MSDAVLFDAYFSAAVMPWRAISTAYADRGYDHDKYRRMIWATGVKPVVACRGVAHGSGLGLLSRIHPPGRDRWRT